MAAEKRSIVMGIFRDHTLANQACDELRATRWAGGDNQVRLVSRSSGGILARIKDALAEPEGSQDQAAEELSRLDLPEDQRQLYLQELENGAYLVIAYPYGHQLETRDIMHRFGGYNVFTPLELGGERRIPVRQEVPQVQKQVVEVGEIRIHKRVIAEERTFTVPVTREEVTIERLSLPRTGQPTPPFQANAGDQEARHNSPVDPSATLPFSENEVLKEEGTLRILVREEQVLIHKQPVVVEEIVIHKHMVEEIGQIVEPIRHEEVHIERLGNAPIRENTEGTISMER